MNRRTLLRAAAGFPGLLTLPRSIRAAQYDLVIRNGRVIDPAQNIDRIPDVAVRPNIGAAAAVESFDAQAG
ncbi:MAG TPA: hypothetical protein VHY84_06295 [Bryobacteraceae bacterium]|jgi:hypothetical protein|nr:hypothetical protein [Bryobacteraceae bacterium]